MGNQSDVSPPCLTRCRRLERKLIIQGNKDDRTPRSNNFNINILCPIRSNAFAKIIMENSVRVVDDYYQLDMPFRERLPFPNNRAMAEKRMNSLKTRFKKDPELYVKYKLGIDDYVRKGFASKVQEYPVVERKSEVNDVWYLPHHPVFHPQKPQKPRIVFDCAAQFEGVS